MELPGAGAVTSITLVWRKHPIVGQAVSTRTTQSARQMDVPEGHVLPHHIISPSAKIDPYALYLVG